MLHDFLKSKGLTPKQIEVCELVAKGLNNKEVANQLFIKEKSVKYHLTAIYEALAVKSRVQMILTCLPHMGWTGYPLRDRTVIQTDTNPNQEKI
jgi:LuxR family transcriptional regulator, positive regulator of biofilm formation